MWIYSITNKINGKQYIGKTEKHNCNKRWKEHKRDYKKDKGSCCLYRAIRKYGIENFEFKQILECFDAKELVRKETEYIIKYNTLSPNGYNLVLFKDKMIFSMETIEKKSKSMQRSNWVRLKNGSKYIGISKKKTLFCCSIWKNRKIFCRNFRNEEDAARMYDKMAIYLYGGDAKLNFKREDYSKPDIDNAYKYFTENPFTSKYFGVSWDNRKNKWAACVYKNNKCIKTKFVNNEIEAAKLVDMAYIYFGIQHILNFPELKEEYLKIDLNQFFSKRQKSSKYIGVCYYKNSNKFVAKLEINKKVYHCGYFNTQEEAYLARIEKEKEVKQNLYGNKI